MLNRSFVVLALLLAACSDDAVTAVDSGTTTGDAAPPADSGQTQLVFSASFDADGADWPSPWTVAGGVAEADVQNSRARLVPLLSGYSLARMVAPGTETDVESTFDLEFDELETQGVGYYVRQNGGYLGQTSPTGAGYAVFIEGFSGTPGIGLWRERDGDEQLIERTSHPTPNMQSNVVYRVRFRVQQSGNETVLQAKIWPRGQDEPDAWSVETTDSSPELQNLSGGYAFDAWNSRTSGGSTPPNVYVDELHVYRN